MLCTRTPFTGKPSMTENNSAFLSSGLSLRNKLLAITIPWSSKLDISALI
jgi:hypothetical protein